MLAAFDSFARTNGEKHRFETLISILAVETSSVALAVACAAFINVVVHCVPDKNYQVALQHEFTVLGLMNVIKTHVHLDSEDFREQFNAYQENFVDVSVLTMEAEKHLEDLEIIEDLKEDLEDAKTQISTANEVVTTTQKKAAIVIENMTKDFMAQKALTDTVAERLETEKMESRSRRTKLETELSSLKMSMLTLMTTFGTPFPSSN